MNKETETAIKKANERIDKIVEIAKRAEQMGIRAGDRTTIILDLENADEEFNLRLDDLLNADRFNFAHDITGIQRHINRETGKMEDCFVPRYAGKNETDKEENR